MDLFGNDTNPMDQVGKGQHKRLAEAQHGELIKLYGEVPGKKCKDCGHFYVKKFAKKYPKCALASDSGGRSTDWNSRWQACGKFEPDETEDAK